MLKCDSVIKSPKNGNNTPKKNFVHNVAGKNVSQQNQNLFDFELDRSNDGRETQAYSRKRKNETTLSSEKQSTQKQHCSTGSASDNEFETDTFDFELSPIKKKCTRNSEEKRKSENVVQETTNHNKRKIIQEESAENGNMFKMQKLSEQNEDRNQSTSLQLHLTTSSIQSTQPSNASSFVTTSYGFIGKRVTPKTLNNECNYNNSNKKYYSDDAQPKVKNENLEDNKVQALLELTKSFVSLEVVPLVVKKCTGTMRPPSQPTKKIGNVKKFKKQAFVQNRNLIQSKPVLIDLTMQRNGAISRSHDSGISNRKTSLWSENADESLVHYEENSKTHQQHFLLHHY